MKKTLTSILLLFAIIGCGTIHLNKTLKNLNTVSDDDIVKSIFIERTSLCWNGCEQTKEMKQLKTELAKRHDWSPLELSNIIAGEGFAGMTTLQFKIIHGYSYRQNTSAQSNSNNNPHFNNNNHSILSRLVCFRCLNYNSTGFLQHDLHKR